MFGLAGDLLLVRGVRGAPSVRVVFDDFLDCEHGAMPRRYATLHFWTPNRATHTLALARAILRAPRAVRLGVLAHEAGHFVASVLEDREEEDPERHADKYAQHIVFGGVTKRGLTYDRRWGGRGVQKLSADGVKEVERAMRQARRRKR